LDRGFENLLLYLLSDVLVETFQPLLDVAIRWVEHGLPDHVKGLSCLVGRHLLSVLINQVSQGPQQELGLIQLVVHPELEDRSEDL
jgi:hypothetical protein